MVEKTIMIKVLGLCVAVMMLSSCATLKKSFCDCNCDEYAEFATPEARAKAAAAAKPAAKPKPGTKNQGIVVEQTDLDAADRMGKAVDNYVFGKEAGEFTDLCSQDKFDCYVDGRRFPKGRKKIKRKVPPFLSGSKMGLQDDKRVQVKYEFYP
jgi:hypothetical protein